MTTGSQTSCILSLMFDLVPQEHRSRVFGRLVEKIARESNNHVGDRSDRRPMADAGRCPTTGRLDLAYTLACQKTYPSWGYMVEKGATTLWELWNGDTADPAMNSMNHVMLAGDLIVWFLRISGRHPVRSVRSRL